VTNRRLEASMMQCGYTDGSSVSASAVPGSVCLYASLLIVTKIPSCQFSQYDYYTAVHHITNAQRTTQVRKHSYFHSPMVRYTPSPSLTPTYPSGRTQRQEGPCMASHAMPILASPPSSSSPSRGMHAFLRVGSHHRHSPGPVPVQR
jgi:hypothetical protein